MENPLSTDTDCVAGVKLGGGQGDALLLASLFEKKNCKYIVNQIIAQNYVQKVFICLCCKGYTRVGRWRPVAPSQPPLSDLNKYILENAWNVQGGWVRGVVSHNHKIINPQIIVTKIRNPQIKITKISIKLLKWKLFDRMYPNMKSTLTHPCCIT